MVALLLILHKYIQQMILKKGNYCKFQIDYSIITRMGYSFVVWALFQTHTVSRKRMIY